MPIKKSGFKRLRQDKKKHERNKSAVTEIRTLAKKARTLIAAKNREEADAVLKKLESKMDRAVKRNIVKKGTVSRSISRLRKQFSAIKK
jgi:ribosomal protein S20